jgi:hypothetical protein
MKMQQEMFRQMTQSFLAPPPASSLFSTESSRTAQKRWLEAMVDTFNKHRESLDATYKSGIQFIEQSSRVSEAKSAEDYRRMVEDLWRKLFDAFKSQSEVQMKEFQAWAEKSFEMARKAEV